MLKNVYLVAMIGADTAENEQHSAEILPKTGNYPTGPPGGGVPRARRARPLRAVPARALRRGHAAGQGGPRLDRANFRGFVLGCIEAKCFK